MGRGIALSTPESQVERRRTSERRRPPELQRDVAAHVAAERRQSSDRRRASLPAEHAGLRQAAEARLSGRQGSGSAKPDTANLSRLVHELQVHQIELEMQNNQLQQTRTELESTLARYTELYDLSPVGYFSFDQQGMIRQLNLAGALLLGSERSLLIGQHFANYIATDSRTAFASLLRAPATGRETCDITLTPHDPPSLPTIVQLELVACDGGELFRAAALDISARKQAEAARRDSEAFKLLILNSMADQIAVLDREGVIRLVNQAWLRFSLESSTEPGKPAENTGVGSNYLAACGAVSGISPPESMTARQGIQAVLDGSLFSFSMEQPCHSPTQQRWFTMTVLPLEDHASAGVVITHTDISERKLMEEQVRQMAFHDPLTKLPNRRLLRDRLSQTMAASKRSACHGALMFIDLDNFKPLNDAQGHEVGDLLLIEVASRLTTCIREIDTVTRFGGDEFVVMISELDQDKAESEAQARLIAEKIRLTLADPYHLTITHEGAAATKLEHLCTASIGVALFVNHQPDQDELIKLADKAMYKAKARGRNTICFND